MILKSECFQGRRKSARAQKLTEKKEFIANALQEMAEDFKRKKANEEPQREEQFNDHSSSEAQIVRDSDDESEENGPQEGAGGIRLGSAF